MKKAVNFTIYLAIWIAAYGIAGMLYTFVTEAIIKSGFFGDKPNLSMWNDGFIDGRVIWGARHYWYFWTCFFLFCISIARLIVWIDYYWSKKN